MSNGLPVSGGYEATQIYDMNSDGYTDVVGFGNGIVTVWLGDGAGNWTQAAQFTLSSPGDYKAFRIDGDADHNGYPDIVLVDEEGTWINYQNHLRFFKENSPADSLTITPVYPSPNRKINVQSVQTIKWISEVPAGVSSLVKLEISANDTSGPWNVIADDLPNNGHFQWIIPESAASTDTCRIRYTVYTSTDTVSSITSAGFFIIGEPVFSEEKRNEFPEEFTLYQNYPNPFNPSTIIRFSITSVIASGVKQSQLVTLKVYDVLGKEVATLVDEEKPAGIYEVEFNTISHSGQFGISDLPSGIYFYQLKAGEYVESKKMLLIK
ncbi:MAG: T9SS type A sorting domain-containing protein [bacterium]|nr:T9SS type A sorting domain-containing protein [bacterium]